jgi:hypothetical protein
MPKIMGRTASITVPVDAGEPVSFEINQLEIPKTIPKVKSKNPIGNSKEAIDISRK